MQTELENPPPADGVVDGSGAPQEDVRAEDSEETLKQAVEDESKMVNMIIMLDASHSKVTKCASITC